MHKAEQLRWAVDVTDDDVTAIEAFFAAQLPDRTVDELPPDSQEYRTHHALRVAVNQHISSLRHHMNGPGAESAYKAWQWDLSRAHEISSRWCDLVDLTREWLGVEGVDVERWVHRMAYDTLPDDGTEPAEEVALPVAVPVGAPEAETDAYVSEYSIPRQQCDSAYAVVRDPGLTVRWALFEDGSRERHWDGACWQPTGSASSPYHFSRPAALAIARQHAAADADAE
ncbi:hypothetical protein [Streptomyces anulatus]|uniref:hypothetical protein n=1 Tax=Streptomyces anulatus TaxID=1892 RepID=UPI001D181143|nr:hypothetical protein [Streptomyces anulatus]